MGADSKKEKRESESIKKSKTAVAVFAAIMAAASFANAAVEIDFDGNNMGFVNSMELVKIAASTQNNEIVPPRVGLTFEIMPESAFVQDVPDFKEGEARLQIIRKNILKSMPFLGHEVLTLVEAHNTIVCLTGESVFIIKRTGDGKYALLKELIDPKLVESIKKKEHTIMGAGSGNKSWVMVKKYYDVVVYITTLVNGYEVSKPVIKKVCEMVEEWVDSPSEPTGWGPGTNLPNPNHVRSGY